MEEEHKETVWMKVSLKWSQFAEFYILVHFMNLFKLILICFSSEMHAGFILEMGQLGPSGHPSFRGPQKGGSGKDV